MLIVFEGIDGSGKTSLSRLFVDYLTAKGIPALWLREPTDSPLGDKIRRVAQENEKISPQQELDYFIQDRRWDVENNILPALGAKKTVVLDRYFYSNACYQGARGLDMNAIIDLNQTFAPLPDLTFIIDVDVDRALARIQNSRPGLARLFEKRDFLLKVRANYKRLDGERLTHIDGNRDLESVLADVVVRYEELAASGKPGT
ncbi:MAG: dTMP kinase [Candidatus Aminicenantes bacterium]|nr:dTMP kinase [Candidatus Aminicenantes bacterium]